MVEWRDRIFPFLSWWPRRREDYRADLIAGVTVALVLVPQSLAYAQLAGLPPHYGLYAALIPGVVGALWGSSAHLATGPVAMISLLTAASLQACFPGIGPDGYVRMAILLALLVGIMQLSVGLFRLAWLGKLLPPSLLCGFVNAAALVIIGSQLPRLLGLKGVGGEGFLGGIGNVFSRLHQVHGPTVLIGALALAVTLGLKKWRPRFPAALTAAAITGVVVYWLGLDRAGVAVVGRIATGLPLPSLPSFEPGAVLTLLPSAVLLLLTGFMEVSSVSGSIALKSGQQIDLNREMVGQGLAGITGSCFGSFPVSGSFSRSALNFSSGGRTGMSSVVTGLVILPVLLLPIDLIGYLPQATLAVMIIVAVSHLVDFPAMLRRWRENRADGIVAAVTLVATLAWAPHLEKGIMAGLTTALALRLFRRVSCYRWRNGIGSRRPERILAATGCTDEEAL